MQSQFRKRSSVEGKEQWRERWTRPSTPSRKIQAGSGLLIGHRVERAQPGVEEFYNVTKKPRRALLEVQRGIGHSIARQSIVECQ